MKDAQIVVVEDELIVGMMIKLKLAKMGYCVSGLASRGVDAIAMVEEVRPDMVLMDIRLKGGINGVETAMKIREMSNTPIVFITADSSRETREMAELANPQGFLLKPFMDEELGSIVDSVLSNSAEGARAVPGNV
ncbi:response regulator [Methanococcoides alaskense]|uniref:CheY-like chemotaxis protein n=1 Tax=Methanococcoides alaskense TaxID=325778 RepID=A0AA90U0M1_9EURY|nr:response regulator [Methanococcoides alaskense]MDA0524198.1 response regulator [Methanococcoides alaskense]MDR6223681.1 CheY-like chemotaxis protein [Methanococcoides alaskense]